jgi:hypothetical protein
MALDLLVDSGVPASAWSFRCSSMRYKDPLIESTSITSCRLSRKENLDEFT